MSSLLVGVGEEVAWATPTAERRITAEMVVSCFPHGRRLEGEGEGFVVKDRKKRNRALMVVGGARV